MRRRWAWRIVIGVFVIGTLVNPDPPSQGDPWELDHEIGDTIERGRALAERGPIAIVIGHSALRMLALRMSAEKVGVYGVVVPQIRARDLDPWMDSFAEMEPELVVVLDEVLVPVEGGRIRKRPGLFGLLQGGDFTTPIYNGPEAFPHTAGTPVRSGPDLDALDALSARFGERFVVVGVPWSEWAVSVGDPGARAERDAILRARGLEPVRPADVWPDAAFHDNRHFTTDGGRAYADWLLAQVLLWRLEER